MQRRRGTLSFCSSWLRGGVAPESTSGGSLETLRAHSISLNSVPSRHSSITMASVTFCRAQAHRGSADEGFQLGEVLDTERRERQVAQPISLGLALAGIRVGSLG